MRSLVILLTATALVVACGSLKEEEISQAASQPAHELLYVATTTGMSVVDATTDSLVATLPPGTLLPDRSRYWTIDSGDRTTVRALDPATGGEQLAFVIDGRWSVPAAYGPAPSGLSANGKWMVLVAAPVTVTGNGTLNRFAVVDLAQKRIARVVNASGDVGFDAVSDDGKNLYLVEHLVPAPRYAVRVASFNGGFVDGVLGQIKTAEPEAMNGLYHASVAVGSDWFLSLYSNPGHGPFIHALNTTQLYAQCILNIPDVPVALRSAWSMLQDPRHLKLYAVNGAAGVVSEVNTGALIVARSNIDLVPVAPTTMTTTPLHPAALSADGTRIYVAAPHGVIVIYTGDLSVHSRYLTDRLVDSVALSDDGQRLYIASGGAITKVEAATGRPIATLVSAPHALGLLAVTSR